MKEPQWDDLDLKDLKPISHLPHISHIYLLERPEHLFSSELLLSYIV